MTDFWVGELKSSPIGPIGVAASERGVVRISLYGLERLKRWQDFTNRPDLARFSEEAPPSILGVALLQIEEYLLGRRKVFDFPLDLQGYTSLARKVLDACKDIPFGSIRTNRQLANGLGHPGMARFVGNMMARNPLPLVIPCHRVVGSDGTLHGFGAPGGLATKSWLLTLEGQRLVNLKLVK
ncbi:MAG TPA: methylated-DNA--[protein]-cysteine S-methyltransferase [Anaerolineaceae bacterium]|nr:methylated-DNA--[protein]-cysteine S-methyltransferase [Anaerolineaceae bacterium]